MATYGLIIKSNSVLFFPNFISYYLSNLPTLLLNGEIIVSPAFGRVDTSLLSPSFTGCKIYGLLDLDGQYAS